MGILTKKVKHGETKEDVVQTWEYPGDTLAELVEYAGEKEVLSQALVGIGTALRNRLYGLTNNAKMEKNVTAEAAITATSAWMPGVASERVAADPMAALLASFAGLNSNQRMEKILELQDRAAAAAEAAEEA